jgi:zinc protease
MMRDGAALLHGGDRRWASPSRDELAATTIADIRALVEPSLTQGPVEVTIVGDITIDDAIRQVAATFGTLARRPDPAPPAPAGAMPRLLPAATAEPVQLTHGGRPDQALAMVAWPTGDYYADLHRTQAVNLLADLFTSRLLQELRERQGTAYSPGAEHDASRFLPGYGLLMGMIEARPEALPGFLRDAERIAADLSARPVDADELQRALQPRLETLQRARSSNDWWLTNLARIQQDPRVAAALISELADYRAITPAAVQRAAREVLQPGRAWSMVVVPRQAGAAGAH